jgi:phosphoribosylamine--glycine ligase
VRPRRHSDRALRPLGDPAALDAFGLPVVIKADGLAAGKGVVIAETRAERKRRWRRRAMRWSSRNSSAAKERASLRSPTGPAWCRSARPRTTSASATAMWAEYGRHGRLQLGLDPAAHLQERVMAEIVRPTVRAMARRARLIPASFMPA